VVAAGADTVHVDVMDGHFVPNITIGAPVVAGLRRYAEVPLDVHLMIEKPEKYVAAFADAGSDTLSIHAEATSDPRRTLEQIRAKGVTPGIAVSPGTSIEVLKSVLEYTEFILVMTVNPGFGGQEFIPEMIEKVRQVRDMAGPDMNVGVDGGIDPETAPRIVEAGANVLIAGSYIFGSEDYSCAINALRQSCEQEGQSQTPRECSRKK